MSNRAERRARAKSARKGQENRYSRGAVKSRRGALDEMSLQEKSRRLANGEDGEWKPTGHNGTATDAGLVDPSLRDPQLVRKPRSARQWFRMFSWCLIVLSIVAFLVAMWIPNMPMWAIAAICAVFAVGVVSLFFVGGSYKENPKLDSYGTAV
ncbi:tripartite tricarboxylate transporter TctB family protein [Bifidobacterium xylocopae]|uniref:Tripartite tricarboxylate transporter TctB family protein n=1 Tax=Bifidobacterium xylocopae TaxID=2493119 RepID=A0A366KCA1_9BIFI|nr:tripartite tricarboxylate transporter TctB family protein [Bifidobacterium xylocopae]RBP99324.1 hypothetical protein CRD59_04710 [Bifidobacterium xylocopae]